MIATTRRNTQDQFPANKYYYKDHLCSLRKWLMGKIYPSTPLNQEEPLDQIAKTLSRIAGHEPTAYESGMVQTSATGSTHLLTRQVERAITQVLGRGPGRGPEGFISALNGAFPTDSQGQVVLTPTRSLVSLYGSNGDGAVGQISVEQANLYRASSLLATDGLRVLEGLKPFDPKADIDAVEALRALIRTEINSLVEEFGRLDEPRKERVEHYWRSLLLHLLKFGIVAFAPGAARLQQQLELSSPIGLGGVATYSQGATVLTQTESRLHGFIQRHIHPVTLDDEAQLAGYELLLSYLMGLGLAWLKYQYPFELSEVATENYSANLSQASVLLPIIADSNATFMAAMDSVGFTQSERRSSSAKFSGLVSDPSLELPASNPAGNLIPYALADITVNDLNEWIDRFASVESPSLLSVSGRYGLDSVVDQADTLFWVIGLALYTVFPQEAADSGTGAARTVVLPNDGIESSSLLQEILSYERVKQSLRELLSYLKDLADLACSEVNDRIVRPSPGRALDGPTQVREQPNAE